MSDWNAGLYLKFVNERTQPAIDLVSRITGIRPQRIVDVGCGPGNSTAVLAQRFRDASVLGVDNSPDMIKRAKADHPELDWKVCDAARELPSLGGGFDVVFSNACLQWVPGHDRVLRDMMGLLKKGGILAVQVPYNQDEPIKRAIDEAAAAPAWKSFFEGLRPFYTLTPGAYYDILRDYSEVNIWETAYYHVLESQGAILEWYRGTGLRPYLDRLSDAEKPAFEEDILRRLAESYPLRGDNKVLFRFPRLFIMVRK